MKDPRSKGWKFCNRASGALNAFKLAGYEKNNLELIGEQSRFKKVLLTIEDDEVADIETLPCIAEGLGFGGKYELFYGVDYRSCFPQTLDLEEDAPEASSMRGLGIYRRDKKGKVAGKPLGMLSFGEKDPAMAGYLWIEPYMVEKLSKHLLDLEVPFAVYVECRKNGSGQGMPEVGQCQKIT